MSLASTVAVFRLFSEKVSFWPKTLRSLKVNQYWKNLQNVDFLDPNAPNVMKLGLKVNFCN